MMVRIVLSFICALLIFTSSAQAQADNPYVVKDVKVDIVAQSSVQARNKAFSEAQTKAFKMLATRFVGDEASAGTPDPNTIAGMVSDFEITSEQLSKKRYIGTYTFRFKESAVYRYFGHGPLTGSTGNVASSEILFIPVFVNNGKTILWDANKNPWLKLWQQKRPSDILLPLGDTSDMFDAREAEMPNISRVGIKRMKARYGVSDIIISVATFDAAKRPPLKIDLYRTDLSKVELSQSIPVPVGKEKKLGELMAKGLEKTKEVLLANWKMQAQETAVASTDYSNPAAVQLEKELAPVKPVQPAAGIAKTMVRFASMSEWLMIRRALNDVPGMKGLRIISLSTNQADLELVYSDWMAFTAGLASRGMTLTPAGNGYALIRSQTYIR